MALLIAMLSGCSSRPEVYQPAPIPPTIVKVRTFVPLPKDATKPCEEPKIDEADIVTGVDAIGAAARWKATSRCNARKLEAIGKVQP